MAVAVTLSFSPGAGVMGADDPALTLHATPIGAGAAPASLTIELFRWSSDAERVPLMTALSAPPAPADSAPPAGGRAGRGGRGARGAAPPPSPLARVTAATKAAPTVGFIWSDGVTGYSIKYAWRSTSPGGGERIVLVTDRRLDSRAPAPSSGAAADAEFTVIEMRLDAKGAGEAKASLTTNVVVDAVAKTLALEGYEAAPVLLKVTR
jgi:hypothetical protein